MNKLLKRVSIGFLVTFAVICLAILAYSMLVLWPNSDCDKQGKWWSPRDHHCEKVLYLPNVTHRKPGTKAPKPTRSSDPVIIGKAP